MAAVSHRRRGRASTRREWQKYSQLKGIGLDGQFDLIDRKRAFEYALRPVH
jgi:hypothetical protein